jgi:hypothetical protein
LKAAEDERLKAQRTKEEQLTVEKQQAEAAQKAAEADAATARQQAVVTGTCAQLGIKNTDYALFEATRAGKKSREEVEAFFSEQLKDEARRSAYGLATPPPEVVPVPAETAPVPGAPPAPPPAPGSPAPGEKSVMQMTQAEFSAHLAKLG